MCKAYHWSSYECSITTTIEVTAIIISIMVVISMVIAAMLEEHHKQPIKLLKEQIDKLGLLTDHATITQRKSWNKLGLQTNHAKDILTNIYSQFFTHIHMLTCIDENC